MTWREKKRKNYTSAKVQNAFFELMTNRICLGNLNSLTFGEREREREREKKYTSAKVQNEFFELKANIIPRKISENTKISDVVSLMAKKLWMF